MQIPITQLERYLQEVLGVAVSPVPWEGAARLPFHLQDSYGWFQARVLNVACLLMVDQSQEQQSPGVVRKHVDLMESTAGLPVVYVRSAVTSYNRKRLIERSVPFIVPGNQMYLPMLGIDLREHFRAMRSRPHAFGPSTQAALIHCLLRGKGNPVTPSELAGCLGYSAMTMTRAADELEAAGVVTSSSRGRERCLRFHEGTKKSWDKALPYLGSPVARRHFIKATGTVLDSPLAGLTALAHYSMLAEPACPVSAVSQSDWKERRTVAGFTMVPDREPGVAEVEVWSYDPDLFAENGVVDRLSLYLSLRGTPDERVEGALEDVMEGMAW